MGPVRSQSNPGGFSPAVPRPIMTFQGPLPPVIASKVNSATRPSPQRSDNPLRGTPLDQFSASLIGGGSLLGLSGGSKMASISDAERAQLERFLFGPGDGSMAPRTFSSGIIEFMR